MNSTSQHPTRSNLVIACLGGMTCFALVLVAYSTYVHYYYGGLPHSSFFPSTMWGTTQFERDAGWGPIYAPPDAGWDGQFYFRQSTDPFLQTDAIKCSDNVNYRYQRNGIPLIAWCAAKSIGMFPTNGWVFQGTQFAMMGVGFGVLLYWLQLHQFNWAYSVAWLTCGGWFALFHGLPDAGADAIFIVSCFCMMRQHLIGYALSSSLLLLTREGYVAFAAPVFFLSVLKWIPWEGYSRWKIACATALPGLIVVCWACYVGFKTGTRPLSGAGQVPFGFLVDWPFRAYFRAMYGQWEFSREPLLKSVCAFTILLTLIALLVKAKQWRYALVFLPYVLLISMTGYTIWETVGGYPKATSAILVIMIFSLCQLPKRLVSVLFALHLFFGLHMIYHYNVKYQGYMHPEIFAAQRKLIEKQGSPITIDPNARKNVSFSILNYAISTQMVSPKREPYQGVFKKFHRDPFVMEATITNNSPETWYAQQAGSPASLAVAYQVLSPEGKIVQFDNLNIVQNVAPGESYTALIAIPYGPSFSQNQLLIGLFQAPGTFFLEGEGGHPIRKSLNSFEQ